MRFLWGAATASYQIEGAWNEDGKGESIWDRFSHTPGRVHNGDTGDVACDHYHRWREDIALMKELGLGAYRFSLSWPRILPQGTGQVNARGLDFYSRLVDGLLEADIKPFVTLYHWDLPQALEEEGGWQNPSMSDWLTEYALLVAEHLGDRVGHFMVLNEPWVFTWLGYHEGVHAPGKTGLFVPVSHQVNLAHARALNALKGQYPNLEVGSAFSFAPSYPHSQQDEEAAARQHAFNNDWFLRPLLRGAYPEGLWEMPEPVAAPLDFIGVNLYFRQIVQDDPSDDFLGVKLVEGPGWKTDIGWEVWPEALSRMLTWLSEEYRLPLYVTENGCALDEPTADQRRIEYLDGHIREALKARDAGADLRGYFCWSLLDNFEWAWGYRQRFGLVHVDYESLQRTVKASGRWYHDSFGRAIMPV